MSNQESPKIIAEISCNHLQDIKLGYKLIDAAKEAGADYVKIQYYHWQDMIISPLHMTNIYHGSGTPWDGSNLRDLYHQGAMPDTMCEALFSYAKRKDILLFSSVFSERGLEFLEKLGCPMYKIASFENNDYELIQKTANLGKPLIVSTGTLTTDKELFAIKDAGINARYLGGLTLMHCVSAYPTYNAEANISNINRLRYLTNCPIGFSDHTKDHHAAVAATALGAVAIEKHLMLSEERDTLDAQFSLTETEFKEYARAIKLTHSALYAKHDPQGPFRQFKRSLYVTMSIEEGEEFTHYNVKAYRPYLGLDPVHLPNIIGKKSTKRLSAGNPLTQQDIEGNA